MGLYYEGNVEEDLMSVMAELHTPTIFYLASHAGFGGVQQMAIHGRSLNGHCTALVPLINYTVGEIGIHKFCRVCQILWAAKSKAEGGPPDIAHDQTYFEENQSRLPTRK